MNIQEVLASLTPKERKRAPRAWVQNGAGVSVRVIDPNWLRRLALKRAGQPPAPIETKGPVPVRRRRTKEKTHGEA